MHASPMFLNDSFHPCNQMGFLLLRIDKQDQAALHVSNVDFGCSKEDKSKQSETLPFRQKQFVKQLMLWLSCMCVGVTVIQKHIKMIKPNILLFRDNFCHIAQHAAHFTVCVSVISLIHSVIRMGDLLTCILCTVEDSHEPKAPNSIPER